MLDEVVNETQSPGPEVGFEEIAIDLLQARFWIAVAGG